MINPSAHIHWLMNDKHSRWQFQMRDFQLHLLPPMYEPNIFIDQSSPGPPILTEVYSIEIADYESVQVCSQALK